MHQCRNAIKIGSGITSIMFIMTLIHLGVSWVILMKCCMIMEKIGGNQLSTFKTRRLNEFLQKILGYDANALGWLFTWKKLLRGKLVFEKLDRVMFRDDYVCLFPNYLVTNGPFMCSNHAYVFLNAELAHPPKRGQLLNTNMHRLNTKIPIL